MKKIQDIALQHINELRKNEFVGDIESIKKIGMDAANRIKIRVENDPAIIDVAEFYAKAVMASTMLPPGFRDQAVRNAIINCIIEWENINIEFDAQLK